MIQDGFEYRFYIKDINFKQRIYGFFLTMFGAGLSPKAPGTAGALVGLVLWYVFGLQSMPVYIQALAVIVLFFIGMGCCWGMAKEFKEQRSKDDQRIVIDEGVGVWIALMAMPETWWVALLAFGLFRLFDIVKFFPCDWIDTKMKNFWGVMLDDVVAGIYANLVLYIILSLLKWM